MAPLMAMEPSLVAGTAARLPLKDPIGVRTALTMTTSWNDPSKFGKNPWVAYYILTFTQSVQCVKLAAKILKRVNYVPKHFSHLLTFKEGRVEYVLDRYLWACKGRGGIYLLAARYCFVTVSVWGGTTTLCHIHPASNLISYYCYYWGVDRAIYF